MNFITDKQTLDDLNIFGKRSGKSIYELFNRTATRGGSVILEQFFLYPLADIDDINQRSQIIQYFNTIAAVFPFRTDYFDTAEQYLNNTDSRSMLAKEENTLGRKFNNLIGADAEYKVLFNGVCAVIEILTSVRGFLNQVNTSASKTPYQKDLEQMLEIVEHPELGSLFNIKALAKLAFAETAAYDKLLRYEHRDSIKKLLYHIYKLDVYITVANVARQSGFVFPKALSKEQHVINMDDVYHPSLAKGVPNTLHISPDRNIIFLTGANMAGKSTFMKSLGIALYLAHMGFPVAASKMEFSVRDGIYTTINLPDNLNMGYSHFYAEVLRVKLVAEQLRLSKNLFVIFDELFRGTNVKDAYDATVALTSAFAKKRNCEFIVSTHILEAGETLKPQFDNINFCYLPSDIVDGKPVYSYKLQQGISADRHGMVIIDNEGIIDVLKSRKNNTSTSPGFVTDKQTMDDLNILGKYKNNSIYSIFNKVITVGGEKLLDKMFQHPLTDDVKINERSKRFGYFGNKEFKFPFNSEKVTEMQNYLSVSGTENFLAVYMTTFRKKWLDYLGLPTEYNLVKTGLYATIKILKDLKAFTNTIESQDPKNPYHEEIRSINKIFSDKRITALLNEQENQPITIFNVAKYSHLLRNELWQELKMVTDMIFEFDVVIAISAVAKKRGFSYAHTLPGTRNTIRIEDLSHPGISKAVHNSLFINGDSNIMFLTGANMAGKSTFMKSFGVSLYLAHMGFPVSAKELEFSVRDGIYSSINVPDNLSMGYSHYYAEVLRVKKIALEVRDSKNLIVIFDELFKGTNVKDAYDATLSVTEAFGENKNCSFVISTHIIEVGEELRERCENMQFVYLPTIMNGAVPTYTYKLQRGITTDRHGMMIIENEGILEILKTANSVFLQSR
ncbi:MAG TPA: hypothetical protein VK541_16025 [Pedobacter sp.]|uniref:MutS-related protein n=1 Tax=Pedobacter sp. TaxID=1411316 RepID=UPI002B605A13|nr:hypothetical protein [Pedobacter sp.]HMI03995.1 hypothetical protein [Pedobacter sp.]